MTDKRELASTLEGLTLIAEGLRTDHFPEDAQVVQDAIALILLMRGTLLDIQHWSGDDWSAHKASACLEDGPAI